MPVSRVIPSVVLASVVAFAAGCANTASSQPTAAPLQSAPATTVAPSTTQLPVAVETAPSTIASTVATVESTPAPAPSSTVAPTTTTPPPPSSAPPAPISVVAVTTDGDAVHIDGEAVALMVDADARDAPPPAEGPGASYVSGIARAADGSRAWVGLCCEPYAGSVVEPTTPGQQPTFGRAPAIDPSGRYLATGQIGGVAVAITDLSTGTLLVAPAVSDTTFVPHDTMWIDEAVVITLGTTDTTTVVHTSAVRADGDVSLLASTEIAITGDTRLAGLDDANVMIHEVGTDRIVVLSADGAAAALLEAPARSYWFADGDDVVVGLDGTLTVGDVTVPGEFAWAR
ncbi:MAG: hypothetical protein AAGF73_15410 [Actinomycetota bacterium]